MNVQSGNAMEQNGPVKSPSGRELLFESVSSDACPLIISPLSMWYWLLTTLSSQMRMKSENRNLFLVWEQGVQMNRRLVKPQQNLQWISLLMMSQPSSSFVIGCFTHLWVKQKSKKNESLGFLLSIKLDHSEASLYCGK